MEGTGVGADLRAWSDALSDGEPGEPWVVVHADFGTNKRVEIATALLLSAGIPAWLKFEPFIARGFGAAQFLWGDLVPIPIFVPASRAEDARCLLSAPFEDPDGEFEGAEAEIDELWSRGTWAARAPELWRIYAVFTLLDGYILSALLFR
ncbi:MAG: hypothetical protein Q7W30_00900 [Coriobacteriia bacterium]|nr:hypothetical protein [Coriobacteriia bacterium]